MERKIRSLIKDNPSSRLLMTIPGIGYYSAHLILSETGDIGCRGREMLQAIYYVLKKKEPYCPKSVTSHETMVS